MRTINLRALIALFAFLAGCSGGSGSTITSIPLPGDLGSLRTIHQSAPARRVKSDKAPFLRAIYVADLSENIIKILTNTYYHELGTITNGITSPGALSLDQFGNLYVANATNVTEYPPGGAYPSFTYDSTLGGPNGVAVDSHGNVYEVDGATGYINQFFQKVNVVNERCPSPPSEFAVGGVAVDKNGDVFVGYAGAVSGEIVEYQGGLQNCTATVLGVSVLYPGSLALDSSNDLIIADLVSGTVDVANPPYSTITRTIGAGFASPSGVSVNRKNKLAFVSDYFNRNVTVINYQTGANIKVLGSTNGITAANGVVDGPNAVY